MSSYTSAAGSHSLKQRWAGLVAAVRAQAKLAVHLHIKNYESVVEAYSYDRK